MAQKLKEIGVPFIFATGYGERAPLPAELASSAPVVQKPYTLEVVGSALGKLQAPFNRSRATLCMTLRILA
ncbi:hypothetical protein UNPA324_23005 [Bradyrhizobium sp. UNPA324]|nr:hypothetical protein UNPA324_23005 [Bradyrhizobium sp. UNPA324]